MVTLTPPLVPASLGGTEPAVQAQYFTYSLQAITLYNVLYNVVYGYMRLYNVCVSTEPAVQAQYFTYSLQAITLYNAV